MKLTDSGPVEALDPYPLASYVEYIDKATNGGKPLPSLLSLEPLNPLAFSRYVLRNDGEDLQGWRGTLACVEEGQPLQLFTGWPMIITSNAMHLLLLLPLLLLYNLGCICLCVPSHRLLLVVFGYSLYARCW